MKEGVLWLINVIIAGETITIRQEDRRIADHPAEQKKGNVVDHETVTDQDLRSSTLIATKENDPLATMTAHARIVSRRIERHITKNDRRAP